METKEYKRIEDPNFFRELQKEGAEINKCMQCGSCSGSCIAMRYVDFNPRRIIEKSTIGLRSDVLKSEEPWYCAVCYLCTERCPRDVKPADIMAVIKNIAAREGNIPQNIRAMNEKIPRIGRQNEIDDFINFEREGAGLPQIKNLEDGTMKPLIEETHYYKMIVAEQPAQPESKPEEQPAESQPTESKPEEQPEGEKGQ